MKMLAGTEKFGVELKHDTVEKIENGGSIKIINGLNPAFPNCVTIITRKTAITRSVDMAVIFQTNKKTGITYAYQNEPYWDKEKQQSRAKRTLMNIANV